MKKVICGVLVVLMLLPCFALAAGKIDLSPLSVDELIQLKTDIEAELIARDAVKSMKVPTGEYIIGEDIPAGVYKITTEDYLSGVVINDYDQYNSISPDSPVGKATFKDGDTISLMGSIILTKYTGLSFD